MLHRTLLAAVALVIAAPHEDSPRNLFVAESSHTKTFSETSTFQLDSITQSVNGVEVNLGEPVMTAKISHVAEIVDEYVTVKEERLMKRKRSFEDLSGSAEMSLEVMDQSESHQVDLTSPLSGKSVICEWLPDEERHKFSFDKDSSGDADLLANLFEDAEYQMLPSAREVKEDDSWVVDLAERRSFFAPGGLFRWKTDLSDGGFDLIEPTNMIAISLICLSEASQDVEGEIGVTWAETTEVDGSRVAVLELELSAELTANLSEELMRMGAASGVELSDTTFECVWSLKGEGKALWDLQGGHFVELKLDCRSEIEFDMTIDETFGPVEVQAEVSGTTTISAKAE